MNPTEISTVRLLIELAFACCALEEQTEEQREACVMLLSVAHNLVDHIGEGAPIRPESAEILRRLGHMPVASTYQPQRKRSIQ